MKKLSTIIAIILCVATVGLTQKMYAPRGGGHGGGGFHGGSHGGRHFDGGHRESRHFRGDDFDDGAFGLAVGVPLAVDAAIIGAEAASSDDDYDYNDDNYDSDDNQ